MGLELGNFWNSFDDTICMLLNINFRIYQNTFKFNHSSRYFVINENSIIDFQELQETKSNKSKRNIRYYRPEVRKRGENSSKYNQQMVKTKKSMSLEFKKVNWLSGKYMLIFGLRNWTWRVIINGIINEHLRVLNSDPQFQYEIEPKKIKLLWRTFLKVAGVDNLDRVPRTKDF